MHGASCTDFTKRLPLPDRLAGAAVGRQSQPRAKNQLLHHPNKQRDCIGSAQCAAYGLRNSSLTWLEKLKHYPPAEISTPIADCGCTQQGTQATQSAGVVAPSASAAAVGHHQHTETTATLPHHARSMLVKSTPPTSTQCTQRPRCVLLAAAATMKPPGAWLCHKPLSVAASAHCARLASQHVNVPHISKCTHAPLRYTLSTTDDILGGSPGPMHSLSGAEVSHWSLAAQVSCTKALQRRAVQHCVGCQRVINMQDSTDKQTAPTAQGCTAIGSACGVMKATGAEDRLGLGAGSGKAADTAAGSAAAGTDGCAVAASTS